VERLREPGWLARFAIPADGPPVLTQGFSSSDPFDHFDGGWQGQVWDWKGHISRDQYQGVVLGYSLAYDVLTDESVRDLIRADMVTFATELMKVRSICPTINGLICVFPITMQYAVVTDTEPLDISIASNGSAAPPRR
jgi:hypothetical protein